MADLAIIGMGLMAIGGVAAGGFATAMWRDKAREVRDLKDQLDYLCAPPACPYPDGFTSDTVRPHVMCGACGVSVPLESDGFTVSEHNCAMGDLFSHDDLRS